MKQLSLAEDVGGLFRREKATRREKFLGEMDAVIPWTVQCARIAPFYAKGPGPKGGRPPHPLERMLRIHYLSLFFNLADEALEEALYEQPLLRRFVGLDAGADAIPDATTILLFRHLLERQGLSQGLFDDVQALLREKGLLLKTATIIDATLIAASPSTKNQLRERDPDMHSSKKGNQWYFGAKCHIGIDADSGAVHSHTFTSGNVADNAELPNLLHGEERLVLGDGGYHQNDRVVGNDTPTLTQAAMWTPHKKKAGQDLTAAQRGANTGLAQLRAKVEHIFRIVKCQFGYRKVRYWGLEKNGAHVTRLLMASNLYLLRVPLAQT